MIADKICPVLPIIHVCILNPLFLFAVNAVFGNRGIYDADPEKKTRNKQLIPSNLSTQIILLTNFFFKYWAFTSMCHKIMSDLKVQTQSHLPLFD